MQYQRKGKPEKSITGKNSHTISTDEEESPRIRLSLTNEGLAEEGFVQLAVERGPGTPFIKIEDETIRVLLRAGLIGEPVR